MASWPMVAKPIKLCEIALYSLNYFCSMTNKKKGANQLSFTANCLLGKTTVTGIRELEQRGFFEDASPNRKWGIFPSDMPS